MSHPSHKSPIEPGQHLAGRYRVEREIGAGAMGVVVEAWHIELDQRVAIKFLNPQFANDEEAAERFRREARAAVRIESEHVARVLDIGVIEEGRIHYYVMEYLRGQDLARELAEQGPLPVSSAVDYVLQACDAVRKAHAQGIVHRDLKPANLFLAQRPNGERAIKVLDFGISKFTELNSQQFSITDTAALLGSPAYMSPEQLESSRNVDGRADIWSLGVILHELILGEVPFQGESVLQLVRSVLAGGRPQLTSRAGVPLELERVVARCLRQSRDERFASIEQLSEALGPFSSTRQARMSGGTSTLTGVAQPSLVTHAVSSAGPPAKSIPVEAGRPPAPHAQSEATSWGNTQRGRGWRQTIYRRGLLGVLIVLGLGAAAYFGPRPWRERAPSPELEAGGSAAATAPAPPEPPRAEAPPSRPPEIAPISQPAPAVAAGTPSPPSTADMASASPQPSSPQPSSPRPSSERPQVAPAQAPGRRIAVSTTAEKPPAAPREPEAENVGPGKSAGDAIPRPLPAVAKPAQGLDIPDYGGRK